MVDLVGIDEDEVEVAVEPLDRGLRRADVDGDPVVIPGRLDVALRDRVLGLISQVSM